MKIIDLHIYGFGQLENMMIDNLADFQVFYGENEAGKSTIMAFIHAILFGFPTKQQNDLRYEPKQGAKYGGRIRIFHPKKGFAVIERVKGKTAGGDVTVRLENGEEGGEELLTELLSHIEKGIYQAIFSFNLQGLQNIHQMKGEEIGKFLFSAGTLGTDRLAATELELQKELDVRFKPSGKKPLLNEKLQELHKTNDQVKKAAAKNQSYEELIEQKQALQTERDDLQKKLVSIHTEVEKLQEWKKIEPFVKEEKWLELQLGELGQFAFPAKGMERYQQLNQLLQPYNARISSLSTRLENLQKEIEGREPDHDFLKRQPEIQAVLDQIPLYKQFIAQENQTELKLEEVSEKIASSREQLHLARSEEEILSVNTNIYMKDQVQHIANKGMMLDKSKQELEDRFTEEKRTLENLEESVAVAKRQLLPEAERADLERQISEGKDRSTVENKLQDIQEKIAFYNAVNQREKQQNQRRFSQQIVGGLLLLALVFYGFVTAQTVLSLVGAILFIAVVAFFIKGLKDGKDQKKSTALKTLYKEEQKWKEYLSSPQYSKISALTEKLAMDRHRRELLQISQVKLEQQQLLYDKVIDQFEQWERETAHYTEELTQICSVLKIPRELARAYLVESFQRIDQLKLLIREKRQLQFQLERIAKDKAAIAGEITKYTAVYTPESKDDLQKATYLLQIKLNEEQEKLIQYKEKQGKLTEIKEDLSQQFHEQKHIQKEMDQLFAEANAESEADFYDISRRAERKATLEDRLAEVKQQLYFSILSESEKEKYLLLADYADLIDNDLQEIEQLHLRQNEIHGQLASIRHELQMLEEGGSYSEILHQFKQKKGEFEEEAKEWAVYRLAQDVLSQTIEKYKNVHLPQMLSKAESYLCFLTEGNYCKIFLHPSKTGFLIERKDHTVFEANELSQATTEQVYVAIRLALATTLYERFQFPIIIDDSFVNFDANRTKRIIELLGEFKQNQILFFTCHRHLLAYFSKESTLFLNKGAVQPIY